MCAVQNVQPSDSRPSLGRYEQRRDTLAFCRSQAWLATRRGSTQTKLEHGLRGNGLSGSSLTSLFHEFQSMHASADMFVSVRNTHTHTRQKQLHETDFLFHSGAMLETALLELCNPMTRHHPPSEFRQSPSMGFNSRKLG